MTSAAPRGVRVWSSSLSFRVVATFLAALAALMGAQSFSLWQQQFVTRSLTLITDGYLPLAKIVASLERDRQRVDNDVRRLLRQAPRPATGPLSPTRIFTEKIEENIEIGRIRTQHVQRSQSLSAEERAVFHKIALQLDTIEGLFEAYQRQSSELLLLVESGSGEDTQALSEPLLAVGTALGEEIDKLSRLLDARIDYLTRATEAAQVRGTAVAIGLSLLAVGFSVFLIGAVLLALRPITRLTTQVQRLAAGDYSGRVEVRGRDEVALLAAEFNAMVRALQERDRRLERLARAERLALVGQMLAQITHEVRNPLNALSLNAELLAEELLALDPDKKTEAHEILEMVIGEIDRLTDVTGHYLQLARRPPATLNPENIAAIVEDVSRLLAAELAQQGVRLDIHAKPIAPQLVDGNQLRQALINVVRNAVEAGGKHLHLSVSQTDDQVLVSLTDDGPGMTEDEVARACDPFFSTKASGTGLGLAITKQILEDHDGSVRVTSVLGKGATVVLVLPLRPAPHPPLESTHVADHPGR